MRYAYLLTGTLLTAAGLGFIVLAMIGALFVAEPQVQAAPTTASTCDRIERDQQGKLWCMAEMQAEDDNIKIIRGTN